MAEFHPAWLLILSLIVGMLPFVAALASSFVKVSIVLSVLKNAFGAQGMPGALVVSCLSFIVTAYVMSPVVDQMVTISLEREPIQFSKLPDANTFKSMQPVIAPLRDFIVQHIGERELLWLESLRQHREINPEQSSDMSRAEKKEGQEPPAVVEFGFAELALGFLVSELREAFSMAFVVLLPFLVVDLIVANLLMGLGMLMVSPVMISLPIKLFLFVAADGWMLLLRSLIYSYGN